MFKYPSGNVACSSFYRLQFSPDKSPQQGWVRGRRLTQRACSCLTCHGKNLTKKTNNWRGIKTLTVRNTLAAAPKPTHWHSGRVSALTERLRDRYRDFNFKCLASLNSLRVNRSRGRFLPEKMQMATPHVTWKDLLLSSSLRILLVDICKSVKETSMSPSVLWNINFNTFCVQRQFKVQFNFSNTGNVFFSNFDTRHVICNMDFWNNVMSPYVINMCIIFVFYFINIYMD